MGSNGSNDTSGSNGTWWQPSQAIASPFCCPPSPHQRSALILVGRPCRLGLLPAMALKSSSHLLPFLAWAAYDGRNDVKLPRLDTTSIIRQRAEFIYTQPPI